MGHGNYIDPFERLEISPRASLGRDDKLVISSEVEKSIRVGAGETLRLLVTAFPGESMDRQIDIDLVGEGAHVELSGLYLCPADERVRITVRVHHRVPGCTSQQLFKGIVGGTAQVAFDGRIIVAPDAQKTEAYQENHNLLLSETAVVDTKPQLEIYADDVKCSHGATVGRLSEDEQFYMRSRGIPEAEARILQMLSFLSPVIDKVEDESERDALRERVEKAVRHL